MKHVSSWRRARVTCSITIIIVIITTIIIIIKFVIIIIVIVIIRSHLSSSCLAPR